MKSFCIFSVVFLAVGLWSVTAQDLIILRDGSVIESKVTEISPTEIRYKRFDHLDGPTIVVPASNVLSIRYENGKVESITASPVPNQKQKNTPVENSGNTAINPNKFIFGINANAGGAFNYIWDGPSGSGINIELGKGRFNSEINLMFPIGGFGALFTFNGFFPSKIGGFYLGGGIGFSVYETYRRIEHWIDGSHPDRYGYGLIGSLPLGLNIGYKFVTKSGLYFRLGTFLGYDCLGSAFDVAPVYFKPDIAMGWTMK